MIGTLHFANIAISYRCFSPACLTGDFFLLFLVKSYRVGRVGAVLSAGEGAGQLHLLGYFDPFLFFQEGLILHDKVYDVFG